MVVAALCLGSRATNTGIGPTAQHVARRTQGERAWACTTVLSLDTTAVLVTLVVMVVLPVSIAALRWATG